MKRIFRIDFFAALLLALFIFGCAATKVKVSPYVGEWHYTYQNMDGSEAAAIMTITEAVPDLRLYFFSMPGSLHARHLAANPNAAAAIYPASPDWQSIHGLQLRGRVEPVPPGSAWQTAWDLYAAKFPFVVTLKAEVTRNTLYVFILDWIRLVDNRRGFGFKQEWTR